MCPLVEPIDSDAPTVTKEPHPCDTAPDHGPGTELEKIFGRDKPEGCDCERWICQMDLWGVEGCHEHRDEIVDALMDSARAFGKVYERWAARSAEPVARWRVGRLVDRAIERAAASSENPESSPAL